MSAKPFAFPITVVPEDIDFMGHVNNARYLAWVQDAVLAHSASPLFRAAPYILFACMWLAVGIVPMLATDLPFAPAADVIALVGLFALARVFISLAAMDIGTSFGTLGARREMMIGFLAEPAILMTLFTASLISHSTPIPPARDDVPSTRGSSPRGSS